MNSVTHNIHFIVCLIPNNGNAMGFSRGTYLNKCTILINIISLYKRNKCAYLERSWQKKSSILSYCKENINYGWCDNNALTICTAL